MSTPKRPSCKCYPSPPGGITECQPGQIAVCGDDGSGVCRGSCIGLSTQLSALNYAADLLSPILRKPISVNRLTRESYIFRPIITSLLGSSLYHQPVNFIFEGQVYGTDCSRGVKTPHGSKLKWPVP